MKFPSASLLVFPLLLLPCGVGCFADEAPAPVKTGPFLRVTQLKPANVPWRVHISSYYGGGTEKGFYVGQTTAEKAEEAPLIAAGQATPWVDMGSLIPKGLPTVRFVFEPAPAPGGGGVQAKIELATAPKDAAIVASVTDQDDGDIISARVPADAVKDKAWFLTSRQDSQRRLDQIKGFKLPNGPMPQKIWTMTGFRSNGQFYTSPDIAETDFDIIKALGMNGYWEQNGGQPGALRAMAQKRGINRSTVYWRNLETLPKDPTLKGVRLQTDVLSAYLQKSYHDAADYTVKAHNGNVPELVVDLADEPDGIQFVGPEYQGAFHAYLQNQKLTPEFFGQKTWDSVISPQLNWWNFFKMRDAMDMTQVTNRRLFLWATRFWNIQTARLYSQATKLAQENAARDHIKLAGTRVNFGPPWLYDYGTLARGIDAFEFFKQNSVTLGFNEDWTGSGTARTPLEINTLLEDWSRAAARPKTPVLGSYITRDANRNTVKLRTFGALARGAKIFDFYYYGPAYTFFDWWSDNAFMVQGVGELTRQIGPVDDLLYAGKPPQAQVALLYSKTWPVWKLNDSEQDEQTMTYLALLHAGVPVDIVSDREIADGSFAAHGYKALYVVNESIPTDAATAIQTWVKAGGRLWAEGWTGLKDEYNTPTDAWNTLLGAQSRSWKPLGEAKLISQPIAPADWKRPGFLRQVAITPLPDSKDIKALPFADGGAKAYQRTYGQGLVQVVPWSAGREYMVGATESERSLGHTVLFPTNGRRSVFTDFALSSGAQPPAVTSVSQILAWPLWSQKGGVVLLANFTGEAAKNVKVDFSAPMKVKGVRSLKHGELALTRMDKGRMQVTLPVDDVTDVLVVER